MSRKPKGYWNYDTCFEEAKKFHSRGEFSKGNERPYQISLRNGWMDEFFPIINKAV